MARSPIEYRDIAERKAVVEARGNEYPDNYPNATRSYHSFVTDIELRNNEGMAERNYAPGQNPNHKPRGEFKLTDKEVLGIGPTDDLLTPAHRAMGSKCCRLIFFFDEKRVANIFRVHGEAIQLYQAAQGGDIDQGIIPDLSFGFQMQDRANGYPCDQLLPNGRCGQHVVNVADINSEKPQRCKLYPWNEEVLKTISTCSYTWDNNGNRSGSCDGCGAF